MSKISLIALLVLLSGLASCGKQNSTSQNELSDPGKIHSNRPQNFEQFIAIIRLEKPALLETAKWEEGKLKLDADHKKAVEEEQKKLEEELKALSSKVVILNRYKLVLNGLAIVAPKELESQVKTLTGVSYLESEGSFARPQVVNKNDMTESVVDLETKNSVSFIEALKVRNELSVTGADGSEVPVNGSKVTVGVIDSGIDFTHAMLGGPGTVEAFKAAHPDKETDLFPNKKVVGGIDLVGTDYNSGAGDFKRHIPKPDKNPIDEGGHGTHVAGTIAGIGDGTNTYSGVAPGADLHAIKVFGKNGSTGDTVIIAAFEYAMDPNGDGDPSDRLDVLNLSLGSSFGKPQILYKEAIKNTVKAGTIVVASAGNSGHVPYIVGAPSTANEAISVAASIDHMEHNWKFDAVEFNSFSQTSRLVEAVEGSISKPISDIDEVSGKLVHVGLADEDLSDELAEKVKGNVALIDRGKVTFVSKLERVKKAGAIGAIVANNKPGDAFAMGGDGEVDIPAIMITQTLGTILKADMKKGDASINFKVEGKIEKPELIDTLTGFTSQGPRSQDALLKPEIAAPGYNIISADIGTGKEGVQMSGTSMAGPHVAGVAALLKQYRKGLSPAEYKSLMLSSAKSMVDKEKKAYPISLQGAGRVQVYKAATQKLLSTPQTLSLGVVRVDKKKMVRKTLTLKNLSSEEKTYSLSFENRGPVKGFVEKTELTLPGGESAELNLFFEITPDAEKTHQEFAGFFKVMSGEEEVHRVPFLGVSTKVANVKAKDLKVFASSGLDASGAYVTLDLENTGNNAGKVFPFNLLGKDERKPHSHKAGDSARTRTCDLQAVGYRVVEKEEEKYLEFGVKLYEAVTRWQPCEVSILIDGNGDGVADQELVGIHAENLSGFTGHDYFSLLLDAKKVRELRAKWENDQRSDDDELREKEQDYTSAVVEGLEMKAFNHSTVAIVSTKLNAVKFSDSDNLLVKVSVLNEDRGAVEADDFLGQGLEKWLKVDPRFGGSAFVDMPEMVEVAAGKTKQVAFKKGESEGELLLLYPNNPFARSSTLKDQQGETPLVQYLYQ